MLSTIGRAALRRAGIRASHPQSTNRTIQSIWNLQRVDGSSSTKNTSASQIISVQQRSYATATKTVVKPKSKPKAKAAAKPKKKAAKKPAAKKKIAATPKAKGRPRVKKVLTEEDKLKAQVKLLKQKALLSAPRGQPSTAWQVLLSEAMKETPPSSGVKGGVGSIAAAASLKYKSLSPAEKESYNHTASQNKVANEVAYKNWIDSHTPDQIHIANNARLLLKKKLGNGQQFTALKDARLPKRPTGAQQFYMVDKFASGDFKGIGVVDATKVVITEWAALSSSEKKPYEDRAAADKERYVTEYKTVFGRDPPFLQRSKSPA